MKIINIIFTALFTYILGVACIYKFSASNTFLGAFGYLAIYSVLIFSFLKYSQGRKESMFVLFLPYFIVLMFFVYYVLP